MQVSPKLGFTFAEGLRSILRHDPDVIMVGEARDTETADICIRSAMTGHLVFSTLHTNDAIQTVDRIIDVFPAEQQQQIRFQLSMALLAIVSQRLLPRVGGKGRVMACELLKNNTAVANMIREGKTFQIPSSIQTGKRYGMQLLDDAIMELLNSGKIHPDDAYAKANDKGKFRPFLKTPPTDFTEA